MSIKRNGEGAFVKKDLNKNKKKNPFKKRPSIARQMLRCAQHDTSVLSVNRVSA